MTERDERGQLVLIAALALVVALVPLVFAYLQLGYHGDSRSGQPGDTRQIERTLDRSLHDAVSDTEGAYPWNRRTAAVTEIRDHLDSTIVHLERADLSDGVVSEVSYNETRATRWAALNCPRGPNRQFGPCAAERGVVVQERNGRVHVLAVAVDVRVTTARSESRLRTVLDVRTE